MAIETGALLLCQIIAPVDPADEPFGLDFRMSGVLQLVVSLVTAAGGCLIIAHSTWQPGKP